MTIPVLLLIIYLATLGLIPVVITKKKRPVTSLAWILAIVLLPGLGAFLFLTFGTEKIENKGRKKFYSNAVLRKNLLDAEIHWRHSKITESASDYPIRLKNIIALSQKLSQFNAVRFNSVEMLTDVDTTYDRICQTLSGATNHINMEYYMFMPDSVGMRFQDLLIAKAREGVKVNFLYDALGSHKLGWDHRFLDRFWQAGIRPRAFLPLRTFTKPWNVNLRNHRKIVVVDNQIGYTGSLNIGSKFLNNQEDRGRQWRETHVELRGPAVSQLQWVFAEDWFFATGEKLPMDQYFVPVKSVGDDMVQVVASGPDETEAAIHKVFIAAISQAEKSVYLTTPYFIPDQPLNLALRLAALRGVDVRILLPNKSDHTFVLLAGRSYYDDLMKDQVKIYEYMPSFLHAKMLIVDGHFTIIGSANADIRSFQLDFEVNLQIYNESIAKKAEKVFLEDLENSRLLDPEKFAKRSAYNRFVENYWRLLSPLL